MKKEKRSHQQVNNREIFHCDNKFFFCKIISILVFIREFSYCFYLDEDIKILLLLSICIYLIHFTRTTFFDVYPLCSNILAGIILGLELIYLIVLWYFKRHIYRDNKSFMLERHVWLETTNVPFRKICGSSYIETLLHLYGGRYHYCQNQVDLIL